MCHISVVWTILGGIQLFTIFLKRVGLFLALEVVLILIILSAGVQATYLLAVAFLEIIRFSSNGGILNCTPESTSSRSAFSCVFEYLKSPSLMPAVFQCLTAVVHRAFETALSWLVFFSSHVAYCHYHG